MDSLNKVISFILGLLVVVFLLAIIAGKIKIPGVQKTTISATPNQTITPSPSSIKTTPSSPTLNILSYHSYQSPTPQEKGGAKPTTIPSTGAPTMLLPSLISTLVAGMYLRNRKQ